MTADSDAHTQQPSLEGKKAVISGGTTGIDTTDARDDNAAHEYPDITHWDPLTPNILGCWPVESQRRPDVVFSTPATQQTEPRT